ncbi:MAG: NADH-quinone oxidoreductase subunit L, partial [Sphingomicrobium sp.]
MHPVLLIVFLPLVAAIIAGLGGHWIGKTAAKVVTTGALFAGALLSWPILFQFIAGDAQAVVVPVAEWFRSGSMVVEWALRLDALTAVMLVVVT